MELTIDCLALAVDLLIFSDSLETFARQIGQLKTNSKDKHPVLLEKADFIANITPAPRDLEVDQGKVKQAEKFMYLSQWIGPYISEKEAFTTRITW